MDEPDRPFEYNPLQGPSQKIRLLQFEAQSDSTSPTARRIHTKTFAKAPPYSALSYTWGPPEPQSSILINGHILRVRENCLFALGQLRSALQPSDYFWIDAICINQDDVDEKSSQVQFMGEIYSSAMEILVSLGEHDDFSRTLLDLLQDLESKMLHEQDVRRAGHANSPGFGDRMYYNNRGPGNKDDDSPPWYRWYGNLSFAKAREFLEVLWQFSQRPYWRRLWILQEAMLAKRARLLCGSTTIEWTTLSLFCGDVLSSHLSGNETDWSIVEHGNMFLNLRRKRTPDAPPRAPIGERYQEMRRDFKGTYMRSLLASRSEGEWPPNSAHLPHILNANRDRLCSDPRDRVFGLLHLVRGTPKLQVDYRLSALRIAIEAVKYFGPTKNPAEARESPIFLDYESDFLLADYVHLLQQQLEIDRQSEDFVQLALSRLGLPEIDEPRPGGEPAGGIVIEKGVIDPNFLSGYCCPITKSQDGMLSAALEVYSSEWSDLMEVVTAYDELAVNQAVVDCISSAQKLWPNSPPLPLYGTLVERENRERKKVVIGLCSGNTREGDILARPMNKNDMLHALILRPGLATILNGREEHVCQIIGQAILIRGCSNSRNGSIEAPGELTNLHPHRAFTVGWSIEDAFLFYARETDELKRCILHNDDAGRSWSGLNGKWSTPLPTVPVDFVNSAIRLVTSVTSRNYSSSFAIVNAALRIVPEEDDQEDEDELD